MFSQQKHIKYLSYNYKLQKEKIKNKETLKWNTFFLFSSPIS